MTTPLTDLLNQIKIQNNQNINLEKLNKIQNVKIANPELKYITVFPDDITKEEIQFLRKKGYHVGANYKTILNFLIACLLPTPPDKYIIYFEEEYFSESRCLCWHRIENNENIVNLSNYKSGVSSWTKNTIIIL